MAAATDKARFYLEQYVPELQEYERKQIFSHDEIQAITRKRSDFEHVLNARGSTPSDYSRYATYEMNLDSLRKKRCKRLGVKNITAFNGQRTVFFILDRATRKFPGDLGLWMQYIEYCQGEKAHKKLAKVFASVLRLRPADYRLWVLAAKHYAETQGDMATARSYLQRGLRFCNGEKKLYMEYAKLEMVYLSKLAARRKILGLDETRKVKDVVDFEDGGDSIALPDVTMEDLNANRENGEEEMHEHTPKTLADAPAYTGRIPMTIFDAAMKQCKNDSALALDFFDLFASFDQVVSTPAILEHVYDHLKASSPNAPEAFICEAQQHLFNLAPQSVDFPSALGRALACLQLGQASTAAQPVLAEKAVYMLLPYLRDRDELDFAIVKVLATTIKRYVRILLDNPPTQRSKLPNQPDGLVATLRREGREGDAGTLLSILAPTGSA